MKIKKIQVLRVASVALTIGMIGFIFWNSSQVASVSESRSGWVLQFLQEVWKLPVTETMVRKTAHFLEFCALGILLGGTTRCYTRGWMARVMIPLFGGLLIPVCDEFLQTFIPGRSGEVRDVLIDFAGAVTGIAMTLLVTFFLDRHRRKRQELILWR